MPSGSSATNDSPASRRAALSGLFAWLLLCGPALLPGVQLGDRDAARLYYPVKQFFAQGLWHGELRFWAPWAEGGVSLLGQLTPGLLHPFTLLYVLLPFSLAFTLNHLLALLVAGAGLFLLARRLGAGPWAALAGALAYAGCGPLVSAASGNLPYALGFGTLPLALAALFWFCDEPRLSRLLPAAGAFALISLGGDAQSAGTAALLGGLWAAVRARAGLWRAAWVLICAGLLAAPAVLPAAVQLQRSARAQGLSAEEKTAFSVAPQRLLGLLVPRAFDASERDADVFPEYLAASGSAPFFDSILFGAPALLLALCAGRRARWLLLGAALLALGATGGVLQAVLSLGIFRYAEKLLAPACLLLAAAAALGAQRLHDGDAKPLLRASLALCAICLLGLVLPLEGLLQSVGRTHDPSLPARFLGLWRHGLLETLALSGGLFGLCLWRARPELRAGLAAALCGVSALLSPPLHLVAEKMYKTPSSTAALARKLIPEGELRVFSDASRALLVPGDSALSPQEARILGAREALWPQLQELDGLQGVAPYFSAPDAQYLAALKAAPEASLALLGTNLRVLARGEDGPAGLPESDSGYRLQRLDPLPRAFVVYRAREDRSPASLRTLALRDEALLWRGPPLSGSGAAARATLIRPSASTLEVQLDAPAPGLLIVGEHFDPGWSATLDGAVTAVEPADLIALGVRVPAGQHRVSLRFVPAGLVPGLCVCAATVLAALALRKRRLA